MNKYRKFYVALAGFLAVVAQVTTDGVVDATDIGLLATALATALGVLGVANKFTIPPEAVEVIDQAKAQVDAAAPVFSTDEDGESAPSTANAKSEDGRGQPGR